MNANRINSRLKKLGQRLSPPDDGTFTLEEVCHTMWEGNKGAFLALARGTSFDYFSTRFEREDAERLFRPQRTKFQGRRL